MNYAINIAAVVLAALIAGLCKAGALAGSALLLGLCALVLLIYMIFKGFGTSSCETAPMIVATCGMIYLLWEAPAYPWGSWEISEVLRAPIQVIGYFGYAWAKEWILALLCAVGLISFWLLQKKWDLVLLRVLRYGLLSALLTLGMEAVVQRGLGEYQESLLLYPMLLIAALGLAGELRNKQKKLFWKTLFGGFAYACLLPMLWPMLQDAASLMARLCSLIRLEKPAMWGMLLLAALTLLGQNEKKPIPFAYRRPAALGFWLVYLLLLHWRCEEMALEMGWHCWAISALTPPIAKALYYREKKKPSVKAQLAAAALTLLGMLTASMASMQTLYPWRVFLLALGLWLGAWLCEKVGSFWKASLAGRDCFLGAAAMALLLLVKEGGTVALGQWIFAGMLAACWCGILIGLSRAGRLSNKSGIWPEEYQCLYKACTLLPLLPTLVTAGYIIF